MQCAALWDRPCRALPKVCGGQECRASKCAVSTHTCAYRVMGLMLVYVPCGRGGESTLLYVCWVRLVYALCVRGGESSLWLGFMCGLGDRAGTHPRGVASAVFPNLYSVMGWWKL